MALKKEPEKHANHERWLVSYADFITLLFAVFVVLYAMSQSDVQKVAQVAQALRESFGYSTMASAGQKGVLDATDLRQIPSIKPEMAVVPMTRLMPPAGPRMGGMDKGRGKAAAEEKEFKEIQSAIEAYLIKHGAQNRVSMSITSRGLVISLKEAGFFDSGSSVVKASGYQLLNTIIEAMTQYSNPLRIEGHTDNIPINSSQFPSNWELSAGRATNVLRYLLKTHELDPAAISATGYAEFRPTADNSTPEGRSQNRRVDIVMLSSESTKSEPVSTQPTE